MTQENNEDSPGPVSRVIDFRIPLPYLLSGTAVIGWALVSMWFSVAQLVKTVDELQITVKSGNGSVVVVSGELALLKFRLTNTESAVERLTTKQEAIGARK